MQEEIEETKNEKVDVLKGFKLIFYSPYLATITFALTIINIGFVGYNVYVVKIANSFNSAFYLGIINSALALGAMIGSLYVTHHLLNIIQ